MKSYLMSNCVDCKSYSGAYGCRAKGIPIAKEHIENNTFPHWCPRDDVAEPKIGKEASQIPDTRELDDLYRKYKKRIGNLENGDEGVGVIIPIQEKLAIESFIDFCKNRDGMWR